MRNRIDEKDTVELFEKFYISTLANDAQLAELFNVRSRELDEQIKEVTNKLKELASKINAEQTDVYKLNDAFKDLGIEINNISLLLKSLANSNRSSFITKEEAKLKNEYIKDDYEVKIQQSERKLIKALFANLLKNFEQKIEQEDKALLKKRFYPLIEIIRTDIIEEELNQRGQFRALLEQATEQYAEVNNKVMFLSDIIDKMRSHEEEVLSEEKLRQYVGEMKKEVEDYSAALYGKISTELDSLTETNFSSIEAIQTQYQQIISILNGQINEIDRDGMVKAFKPLIRELIDVELGERGRFVQLLSQSIDKLSKEKDEEIKNTFRKIVTTIVGEGTKQNQRMALQNTKIGLRKMSESDIDELLGRKILNIVDRSSNISSTLNVLSDKVNSIAVFGGGTQKNIAQKFFDGLSFSIYYYKFTISENIKITGDSLLPEEIKISDFDYIGEFEKIIIEFEKAIEQIGNQKDKYKRYKKAQIRQFTDNNTMLTFDVYCYFRYYDDQKAYFFLNQEPSTFFKRELDNVLTLNLETKEAAKRIEELVKNYSIPKVQIAVFNKDGFYLPSEDYDDSVVSTKTGDKELDLDEEEELSKILDKIETHYANQNTRKGIFNFILGNKKSNEHYDKDGLWHFWAIKAPIEKYLAVKMAMSFDDQESECAFVKHVSESIWNGLQKSKNACDMQDWVDFFIHKDSNILNADSTIIRLIKYASKNWLSLFTLMLLAININWIWIEQSRLQSQLPPNIEKVESALYHLLIMYVNSSKPFIFEADQNEISFLNQADLYHLEHIRDNIELIAQDGEHVEILLIPHLSPQIASQQLNLARAKAIKDYLTQNINKNYGNRLTVNIEKEQFLPEKAHAVSIRLLSIDQK